MATDTFPPKSNKDISTATEEKYMQQGIKVAHLILFKGREGGKFEWGFPKYKQREKGNYFVKEMSLKKLIFTNDNK